MTKSKKNQKENKPFERSEILSQKEIDNLLSAVDGSTTSDIPWEEDIVSRMNKKQLISKIHQLEKSLSESQERENKYQVMADGRIKVIDLIAIEIENKR